MLENLFTSTSTIGLLVLRIGLAAVFIAHGWQKLQGVGMVTGFMKQLNIPLAPAAAWTVTLLETVGAALLILGLGTRVLAVLFVIDMLVAIAKFRIGMMKSAFSGGNATGWEFEFALLAGSLSLVFTGPGAYSLDALLYGGL